MSKNPNIIINATNNVTLQSAKLNAQDNLITNAQNEIYFTFNNLSGENANEIQSILQLDLRNIQSSYVRFNTFQIIDDIKIPLENCG